MSQEFVLKADPEDSGKRLDLFLVSSPQLREAGLSRTLIQRLIQQARITLKEAKRIKPNYKVKAGDEFKLCLEEKPKDLLKPEEIPLEVVYEDKDLVIINKPCGLVVHPGAGNYEHTLVNALLNRFKELSSVNPARPGIVHRLDKETSGLLVIAKNNSAHLNLAKQFARHTIKRKYIALVKGKVEFDEGVIELPLGRHPRKRKNMSVSFNSKSKYAKTSYRTLSRGPEFSLLELEPFTGRTHQLRVHLAFMGHPILGDSKYGRNNDAKRLCLHAQYLGFTHPSTGKWIEFSSEAPLEFINNT